jgi:hypothetical protein
MDMYVCFQFGFTVYFVQSIPWFWQFIWILQLSLLTESGDTKDDLKLPADEDLVKQVSALL